MMHTLFKKHIHSRKGFTLLETLIAIAILTVAIAVSFSIAGKSLSSSYFSKNQTTAFFLASEGLELVRNVRDKIALENLAPGATQKDWLYSFVTGQNCLGSNTCDVDPKTLTVVRCPSNQYGCTLALVHYLPSDIIAYSSKGASAADSFYSRKITISCIPADCKTKDSSGKIEAFVTSTVFWNLEHDSFTVSETLTNWN